MKDSPNYTLDDAINMGFTLEQVNRMVDKIKTMPNHHRFYVGPVGCPENNKILYRLEVRKYHLYPHSQRMGIKYYLIDDATNKQTVFDKTALGLVFRILRLLDNWDGVLRVHNSRISAAPVETVVSKKKTFLSKVVSGLHGLFNKADASLKDANIKV